ncbi:hypothetical protein SLEP1_g15334 [Rubroshorea leprosula]|uniref:Uncharacterized protein n=1 Tax=Rubroshorea leprosula TaxID=152421 RepID=A0AAV5IM07_9ROSI|nr:hypothetical protein SLEP1_g15334 [Rubroshorea leprosula]
MEPRHWVSFPFRTQRWLGSFEPRWNPGTSFLFPLELNTQHAWVRWNPGMLGSFEPRRWVPWNPARLGLETLHFYLQLLSHRIPPHTKKQRKRRDRHCLYSIICFCFFFDSLSLSLNSSSISYSSKLSRSFSFEALSFRSKITMDQFMFG